MMAGGPYRSETHIRLARGDRFYRRQSRTGGEASSIPRLRHGERVGIDVPSALHAELVEMVDEVGGVHSQNLGSGCSAGFDLDYLETAGAHTGHGGSHPGGPFRVIRRRHVCETRGVGDEYGVHAAMVAHSGTEALQTDTRHG